MTYVMLTTFIIGSQEVAALNKLSIQIIKHGKPPQAYRIS